MTGFLFWACLALLLYIYIGYALLLRLLAWFLPIHHPVDDSYCPSVTLLFSAHNERASLPAKMQNLREMDYPRERLQVLAASDASSDGTDEYLAAQEGIEFVALQPHGGKNAALNALLPRATGEILFFTDANTMLHPSSLRKVMRHFADPQTGMVTGHLTFTLDPEWNAVGRGTGLYWRYESGLKHAENQLGSVLVGCGSLLAARRDLAPPLDPRIANDLEIPMRIGAQGYRVIFEPECMGYEKPHTDPWEELTRTSRIVARGVRGFITLLPVLVQSPFRLWQFLSHKVLRWFTLIFAVLMYISSAFLLEQTVPALVFYAGTLSLTCAFLGLLALGREKKDWYMRPFTILAHMMLMHVGATWGILKTLTGHTPATWSVPQSSRKGNP